MHLLKGQWILLIIKFNHQSVQITKVINMINDHWKANDLLININSYWLSQHKFRVDADLTRLVIWHFLVTLDLPQKISAGFCRKCILSEMRWNLARIIKFPSRRSPWINGREERREWERQTLKDSVCTSGKTPKSGVQDLIFLTSGTDYWFVSIHCKSMADPALLGAFHLQSKHSTQYFSLLIVLHAQT